MLTDAFTDLMNGDKALTIRTRRGRPMLQVGLAPGLAVGIAAILVAPRATAAAAVGAMFRGISLTIDRIDPVPEVAEAA